MKKIQKGTPLPTLHPCRRLGSLAVDAFGISTFLLAPLQNPRYASEAYCIRRSQ